MRQWLHNNPNRLALIITILFLCFGVLVYSLGFRFIIALTPIVLAAFSALLLLFWDEKAKKKAIASIVIMATGFGVELIGVHSGLLFGDYAYGTTLGWKLFGVPMLIGVSWLFVSLTTWHILQYSDYSPAKNIILGAVIAVMFDVLLEQFATYFGLWQWSNGRIPVSNYISWFFVSAAMLWFLQAYTQRFRPSIFSALLLPLYGAFFWVIIAIG